MADLVGSFLLQIDAPASNPVLFSKLSQTRQLRVRPAAVAVPYSLLSISRENFPTSNFHKYHREKYQRHVKSLVQIDLTCAREKDERITRVLEEHGYSCADEISISRRNCQVKLQPTFDDREE